MLLGFHPSRAQHRHELAVRSDNDAYLWYGQDRYYTNGLFLNYRFSPAKNTKGSALKSRIFSLELGQKIYNPRSGYSPDPFYHDRPFAAYLYGAIGSTLFYKNESLLRLNLDAGILGPKALGKEAQTLLHKLVGFYEIAGWEYQIGSAVGINFKADYARLLYRDEDQHSELSLESQIALGTIYDFAGLGILFRLGSPKQLSESSYYHGNLGLKQANQKKEVYFYAKPQLKYVLYDASFEGSLFEQNSPITFAPKPLVFSQQLGFNYSSQRFTIDYSMVFLSKELKSKAKAHQYGSIALAYRF